MLDCIVIGAGPGGLVTTKELLEQGLSEVVCLEQAESIGGVFANTYDNLVLTSSCTYSMFSDFWMVVLINFNMFLSGVWISIQ